MESDGERVHPIPPTPRRQVLRPGVRIVAEQFAPYSDEPEEEEFSFGGSIIAGTITASHIQANTITFQTMGRALGKSTVMHQQMEELKSLADSMSAGTHDAPGAFDAMKQSLRGLGRVIGWIDEVTPEPPPKRDGKPRDRKPKKNKKQTEPGYVELTRERRRR